MVTLSRMLRHLLTPDWQVRRRFPQPALQAVEAVIAAAELSHAGEIRFAVEAALAPAHLLRGETARDRAIELFSTLRVWDTEYNSGVLIYVLLADRDVEIVADRGLGGHVSADEWAGICRRMEQAFAKREYAAGAQTAVAGIGRLLAERLPAGAAGRNELPNRPALL